MNTQAKPVASRYHFFVLENSCRSSDFDFEQHYALIGDGALLSLLLEMRPARDRFMELFDAMRAVVPNSQFRSEVEVEIGPLSDVLYFYSWNDAIQFLQQYEDAIRDTSAYRDSAEASPLFDEPLSLGDFLDEITVEYAGMPVFPLDLPPVETEDRTAEIHVDESGWQLVFHGTEKQFNLPFPY